jgi:hypothetical protein
MSEVDIYHYKVLNFVSMSIHSVLKKSSVLIAIKNINLLNF